MEFRQELLDVACRHSSADFALSTHTHTTSGAIYAIGKFDLSTFQTCNVATVDWIERAHSSSRSVRPSVGERAIDSRQQRTPLSPNRLGRRFPFFFLFLSAGCMRSQCQMDQTQIEWRTRWRRQDGQTEKAINLRDLSESGEGVTERVRLDFRAQVPHENVEMFCNYKRKQKTLFFVFNKKRKNDCNIEQTM